MKKWAFVSDFDGTISKKDFYHMVIEQYFPEGKVLMEKWKAGEMKDIDFLATVFQSINQEEAQIIEDILSIPIDEYAPPFFRQVQENGGDVFILSAGTDYYIHHVLKKYGIEDIKVFSNEGKFKEKNVHMNIDPAHKHYSERYGIDKSKVILELKEQYEHIYFAGDSEPDSHPAVYADLTFAKNGLQDLLNERNISFIPVESFQEVETYFIEKGLIGK
ncbi:MtnX-like HAD-IB family phosphatase [Cytobacillus spongiae]|jgi:2,3-diketo-5-methylthio-1-phosphopentane phosphatase|uniref:MtnX-like HAD-IB family phosphatase n=1 Tax=Cytobacillus spongiae TaxID=2901381 RepID=UPI001F431F97|nr:MtnX-like HAD-IB family phosphatase [Cytobacillus spongiae]UII54234.1 MtnX-like HAD-IB family phosphatase [Cytobacillus spongiae]